MLRKTFIGVVVATLGFAASLVIGPAKAAIVQPGFGEGLLSVLPPSAESPTLVRRGGGRGYRGGGYRGRGYTYRRRGYRGRSYGYRGYGHRKYAYRGGYRRYGYRRYGYRGYYGYGAYGYGYGCRWVSRRIWTEYGYRWVRRRTCY